MKQKGIRFASFSSAQAKKTRTFMSQNSVTPTSNAFLNRKSPQSFFYKAVPPMRPVKHFNRAIFYLFDSRNSAQLPITRSETCSLCFLSEKND